jgi:hypothetical protein
MKEQTIPKGKKYHRRAEVPRNEVGPVHSITGDKKLGTHNRTMLRRLAKKKFLLITPNNIHKASDAFKKYTEIVKGVTADLGGKNRLTTVERVLVDAFGLMSVKTYDLASREGRLQGQDRLRSPYRCHQFVSQDRQQAGP